MSSLLTMKQTRGTATINAVVAVQLDNMSVQEATGLGGAFPSDSFWLYTTGGTIPDVQRGDLFVDLNNIDPKTGVNAVYRVFGNPESFDLDHNEIAVEKVVGT